MKKLIICFLTLALVLLLAFPVAVLAKPDKDKPLPASNVELIKKVTLKGPKARGGKPAKEVAAGVLGAPCTGTKYAVVVGISDYPGTANDLEYADDDAKDMRSALINHYDYKPGNVYLRTDLEATFGAIQHAINDLKGKAKDGDEVLFFFSGHGAKGIAADGDKETVDESIVIHEGTELAYIWDGQLKDWFSGFATSRIIFIFDSCLAGGMTDLKASGRVISMATTETGVAYEGDAWLNGQFTYYFVDEGMLQGLADKYDSIPGPDVTVEEAFDYVRANCQKQTPTVSDSFPNDLLP